MLARCSGCVCAQWPGVVVLTEWMLNRSNSNPVLLWWVCNTSVISDKTTPGSNPVFGCSRINHKCSQSPGSNHTQRQSLSRHSSKQLQLSSQLVAVFSQPGLLNKQLISNVTKGHTSMVNAKKLKKEIGKKWLAIFKVKKVVSIAIKIIKTLLTMVWIVTGNTWKTPTCMQVSFDSLKLEMLCS